MCVCVWAGGGGGGGEEEKLYLMLHCHHQNDCIKTGSGESRFNVSLTVREGQSHKTKPTSSV